MNKAKRKPTKEQIETILDVADKCDQIIAELGGVSYFGCDGKVIETSSYFAGITCGIRWMQGEFPLELGTEYEEIQKAFDDRKA